MDGSELGFPTRQSAEHSSRADVIRQITIQPHLVEEAIKITAQVFLPVLRKEPGFLDFYSILVSEHEAVSVSLLETK